MKQLEKVFLWIVKIGLWAIPVLPIYISSSLLFPFITGKNFAFRIAVEIIFVLWAGLAAASSAYRPRLTPIFKAVTIFVGIVFLADLFSPNPMRSFFSNYERMEGFMMIGHLYLYFIMLVSVFKTRRDWITFFHVSLAVSIAVCFYALLQRLGFKRSIQGGFRVDATIGNPTYLGAYLLYHVWLIALLMREFWRKRWAVALYGAALVFELIIIYFTATRGVVLALVASGILFSGWVTLGWNSFFARAPAAPGSQGAFQEFGWRTPRKIAAIIFAMCILIPLFLWLARSSALVHSSPALERLTNYSLNEGTISARRMIWGMSWKGALERPLLGWGQENYYLVFQKYYNPGLYGEEPWFDRSHNIIFDWLVHAGFPGLASYLAILVVALWGLARALRARRIPAGHALILIGLFVSSFFQNLFVFDNLNTYLLFFGFLAYTAGALVGDVETAARNANASAHNKNTAIGNRAARATGFVSGRAIATSLVLGAGAIALIIALHARAIQEGKTLLVTLQRYAAGAPMPELIDGFKRALSYHTFGDTEVREQLANVARDIPHNDRFSKDDQKQFMELAVGELQKQIDNPAKDVKHVLFLGALYSRAAQLDAKYLMEAEKAFQEAIRLSPTKQLIYFELAQVYLAAQRPDLAVAVMRRAWEINKDFREVGVNLWAVAVLAKNADAVNEVRAGLGPAALSTEQLLRVANAYQRTNDFKSATELYGLVVDKAPDNTRIRAIYAALLAEVGRYDEARQQTEETLRRDPDPETQREGKQFLEILKQKQR